MDKTDLIIEKRAYEYKEGDYTFTADYLTKPVGEALIEIKKGDYLVKSFLFPAYKIYNISAHAKDIVSELENDSNAGLYEAGSDGLGGNSYNGG